MKKTGMSKIILAALTAALLLTVLSGCAPQEQGGDRSLQKVLDAGQFVLGLDTEFPPMGFVDENGEIVGFDIDMAREVCSRLGVKLVLQGINWDEKEKLLDRGDIDCIWNGMSVTPAREASMCLSEPYMKNELIAVVRGDSGILTLKDLKGRKIGVQLGSSAYDALRESETGKGARIIPCDNVVAIIEELVNQSIDAALIDSVVAYYYIFSISGSYYILPESFDEEEYAIGFRKNDHALRNRVQDIISEMKADGTLGNISRKWFGSDITIVK